MKWHSEPPQVLIVGAGPVGMTTGLALARRGVSVRIIDQANGPSSFTYGLALHREALKALKELGMEDDIRASAYSVERLDVLIDGAPVKTVALADEGQDSGLPYLVTLPQSTLEQVLLDHLAKQGVAVQWSRRLDVFQTSGNTVTGVIEQLEERMTGYAAAHFEYSVANTEKFKVPWLIACDGWRSHCRSVAGIDWVEMAESTEYAVFECETEGDLEGVVTLALTDGLINVCWPLGSRRCRWSFELKGHSEHSEARSKEREAVRVGHHDYPSVEPDQFQRYLQERVPFWNHRPTHLSWRIVVPFGRYLASSFYKGRCYFAGDATHVTAPGGVQSMNAGMLEGVRLAERLGDVGQESVSFDSLEALQRRTHDSWEDRLGRPVHVDPTAHPKLKDYAVKLAESLPASEGDLPRLAKHFGLELPATVGAPDAPR